MLKSINISDYCTNQELFQSCRIYVVDLQLDHRILANNKQLVVEFLENVNQMKDFWDIICIYNGYNQGNCIAEFAAIHGYYCSVDNSIGKYLVGSNSGLNVISKNEIQDTLIKYDETIGLEDKFITHAMMSIKCKINDNIITIILTNMPKNYCNIQIDSLNKIILDSPGKVLVCGKIPKLQTISILDKLISLSNNIYIKNKSLDDYSDTNEVLGCTAFRVVLYLHP